jgi:hypothetical protein
LQENSENSQKKERMATDNSDLIRDGWIRTEIIKSFTGNSDKMIITTNTNTNLSDKGRAKQDGIGNF